MKSHDHIASTPASAKSGIGPLRILVVDDHDDGRAMMRIRLESEGHLVLEAGDGRSGLCKALEEDIDVAIVDIGLPEMDGYELVRRLRADPRGCELFVIALTGYGAREDIQLADEAGFDLHLTKPMEHAVLKDALRARTRP
jgi:two-component system, sensor histidine kinase